MDTDEMPDNRKGERCVHCNRGHFEHDGWSCPTWVEKVRTATGYPPVGRKSMVPEEYQYCVPSMLKRSPSEPPTLPNMPAVSMDDWRAWRNNRPGECVCGIQKQMCSYHK